MSLDALDVIRRLRQACTAAGSQKAWAGQHALSSSYVSDVIAGRTEPGSSIIAALGLIKLPARYVERRTSSAEKRDGCEPSALRNQQDQG